MAEVSLPKLGAILGTVLSLIKISDNTFIGNFFRWATFHLLDFALDFVIEYYSILMSLALVVMVMKWVKHIYALLLIWALCFLLIHFGLKTVGVA